MKREIAKTKNKINKFDLSASLDDFNNTQEHREDEACVKEVPVYLKFIFLQIYVHM